MACLRCRRRVDSAECFGFLQGALLAGFVGLVWTLPNAVILYAQRRKFTEQAKEKPGM
jgi:hypothetical protein